MKKFFLILVMGIVFTSCQKEEMAEEETAELEVEIEEYFRVEIDGVSYEFKDPEFIKGTIYPSRNSGVINFDFMALFYDDTKEVDFYKEFNFKVCFFDGPGTYYTGTTNTVSWAYFFSDYQYWENHYEYGNEPGEVTVTNAGDEYVEGTFRYEAYNDHLDSQVNVSGEFGLILETPEEYNN